MSRKCLILTFLMATLVDWGRAAETFLAGADLSLLPYFETNGAVYRNHGQTDDAITLLKSQGINCVRLRLFTSSAAQARANPYNYINNLDYTVPLAQRVKRAGLKFWLDFHYSDTWADPGHQAMPSAWTNLPFFALVGQMRSYSSNCIAAFKSAGALPDYVQVGNEITAGMMWPVGQVGGKHNTPAQWSQLARLLNAAIQGIHDAAGPQPPKLVIHIDRGADWHRTEWFFDNLIRTQHVAFDFIGESYYPFFHGALSNLDNCLTQTARRYGKPVIVAETAYPWTYSRQMTGLPGIPATIPGQAQYVRALGQIIRHVPDGLGTGIFWWGTEYQPGFRRGGSGYAQTSWFDHQGNLLPAAAELGDLARP